MYFVTHSFLLKALGSALVNSLWQMAFFWLLSLIIMGGNNRLSSRARHGLSLIMLLAGSVWVMVTFILTISHNDAWQETGLIYTALPLGSNWISNLLSSALPYLSLCYVGVVIFLLIRHCFYHLHVLQLRSSGLHKVQPRVKLFVETIAQRMGIHRKVKIWLSDLVDGPLTLGFYKPIILFPLAMINQLTTEQVEAILLHELAHIRRSDYVVNLVISWLGIIFFFNPFARMLIRDIGKEREHCCDDLVMQFQYEPHAYASALLALEKSRFHGSTLVLAAAGRSRQLLLERVKRLSGQNVPGRRFSFTAMAFLFIPLAGNQFLTMNPLPPGPPAKQVSLILKQDKTQIRYVSTGFAETTVQKPQKIFSFKKRSTPKVKKPNDNLILVTSKMDDGDATLEVTPALGSENREYSIESSTPGSAPVVSVRGMNHPYIPNTSYSYHLQVDTSAYSIIGRNQETQYALENVILALTELNRQEMEIQPGQPEAPAVSDAIHSGMNYSRLAIPGINQIRITGKADEKNLKKEMKKELFALKNAGTDKDKFIFLQRTIRRNQLLIQKQDLENELRLQKIVPAKNKRTVVYI
jgi:beta-lactamase regulating signal transducer with metallopeptidase domain